MIFATVGTSPIRFDRLIAAVTRAAGDERLIVQHGPSPLRPPGAECLDYVSYEEMVRHVRAARAVVAHAGVGSIVTAMANGRRPIVMPRAPALGEAVDEHQLLLARRLADGGHITLVESAEQLAQALRAGPAAVPALRPQAAGMAADLRAYLATRLADGGARAGAGRP